MNLVSVTQDKLEALPKKEGRGHDSDYYYRRGDYPYHRVDRWLRSKVGCHWDKVVSEFTHADWIPTRMRTYSQLCDHVETHTFVRNGKVRYFPGGYRFFWNKSDDYSRGVEDGCLEIFWVDPKTQKLCFADNRKRKAFRAKHQAESNKDWRLLGDYEQLSKIEGVWYYIKGEPIPNPVVRFSNGLYYRMVDKIPTDCTAYWIVNGVIYIRSSSHAYKARRGPRERLFVRCAHANWDGKDDSDTVRIIECRQLNHKELRQHNLKNDRKPIPELQKKCSICGGFGCKLHRTLP